MDKFYYRVYGLNVESEIRMDELEVINYDSDIDLRIIIGNRLKEVNAQLKEFEAKGYKICGNCGSAVI